MRKLEAMLLAFFVEGTLLVQDGVGTRSPGAGMAENVQIHTLLTFYRRSVSRMFLLVNVW
jgi:hypothetical protein